MVHYYEMDFTSIHIAVNPMNADEAQRRMEFPVPYADCERMTTHINYMENFIRITPYPFVKSLYYNHKRNGDMVLARCIYADPENIPDWADDWLK